MNKNKCQNPDECFYFKEYVRFKKEVDLAQKLQEKLIGKIPAIKGIDVGYKFLPSTEMSGDFLNISLIDSNKNQVYIADATGHGIAAATIMLTARAYIKALSKHHSDVSGLVSNVNELLCTDNLQGKFVTLFYSILTLKDKEFSYTCAGHNPPLLFKKSKQPAIKLKSTGMFLGVRPKISYREAKIKLDKKDILILYTDGITERENSQGNEFDEDEISSVVLAHVKNPAQDICDKIIEEAKKYKPISEEDDMTVLAVKIL